MLFNQFPFHRKKGRTENYVKKAALALALFQGQLLMAQERLPLTDLSFFQHPAANWSITGGVRADLSTKDLFATSPGTGVLVDQFGNMNAPADLLTLEPHGDLDLELDYMMAKGANSGIYLQGRYEIQLEDSWTVVKPEASDNGGIYERWDESRPEGHRGYDGHAPRQNASRGPGLWQHLKISFQAPRFDASGNKVQSARVLKLELNGVLIQDNVELSGVTRGAIGDNEVAEAPLRIQGDHGSVAFRNIVFTRFNTPRPPLVDLHYSIYKGKLEYPSDLVKIKPVTEGTAPLITAALPGLPLNDFALIYKGTLTIKKAGEYTFTQANKGGSLLLFINGQPVIKMDSTTAKLQLPAGDQQLELQFFKTEGWNKSALNLMVKGPGIREFILGDPASAPAEDHDDPILINANENIVMRSFMDLNGHIVPHAVSVGSPLKVNYTYDLEHGMLVQAWRGDFLDATPMWHDRGNGMSIPRGAVQRLGIPALALEKLSSSQTPWTIDTTGSGYRPKGYGLDKTGLPVFRYFIYGSGVQDLIVPTEQGRGLRREITLSEAVPDLYVKLAEGSTIEEVSKGFYLIDDKSYYLRLDESEGLAPVIRKNNGREELIAPIRTKLSYSILF